MSEKDRFTTYKRADNEMVADQYGWVNDLEYFADDDYPTELVEEVWVLQSTRKFWHMPEALYDCQIEDQEPCDEDAVGWWKSPDGAWMQVCQRHEDELSEVYV